MLVLDEISDAGQHEMVDNNANKQKNVILFGLGELVRQMDGVLQHMWTIYIVQENNILNVSRMQKISIKKRGSASVQYSNTLP